MTKTSLAAIVAVGALITLAGCSGFDDTSTSGSTGTDITIALATEPPSFDPCDDQDSAIGVVLRGNVTEALTQIDPNTGEVKPLLATSWTQTDETTWTFTLQPGVTFSDGTPFDADAAVTAISRVIDPDLNCGNLEQFPITITPTATDATTLTITTDGPDPILPLRLTYADMTAPSTPTDAKTTEAVGTGPYTIEKRVEGESITLVRNDDYWGEEPSVTSATYVYRTEPSVRAGMITAGEAQIAMQVSPQDVPDGATSGEYNDDRVLFLRTSTDRAPFDDIRVRQALAYAIDKETIVGTLMDGTGTPTDQMLAPTVNGYLDDYTGPTYDPDKAKQLIADAKADGVAVDTKFQLVTRPDLLPGGDEVMQAIAQNLQDVGLNVEIQSLDTDAWLALLRQPFPADQEPTVIGISHDNTTGDASFTYPKYIASDGPNSSISDPVIDDDLAKAAVAQGDERARLYQDASRELYENVGAIIPIADQTKIVLMADNVDYTVNPLTSAILRLADITIQ